MTSIAANKPRLVIYGVGQFGKLMIQLADEKGWPIVAAFNRAGDKVGRDIGEIAGLGRPLGVLVEDSDTADYGRLRGAADIAISSTQTDKLALNIPACERLMGAGLNLLCHASEAYYPQGIDPDTAATIEAIAKRNGATFTGAGLWDMSRIWAGLLAAGPCTRIDSLFHQSTADVSTTNTRAMLIMGVGLTQEEFHATHVASSGHVGGHYKTAIEHVVAGLGYDIVEATETREPVLFDAPIFCKPLDRWIEPGIAVGMRIVGEVKTRQGVTALMHHEGRLFREGEVEHMSWEIKGKPTIRIRVEREDKIHFGASSLFNRVPDVIAAPPGIQLLSALGPLKHTALEGIEA